jgi:hypothetical protein
MERRLRREVARYPGVPRERVEAIVAELPRLDPDGRFRFTDQHRRLLQELRLECPDWQTMSIVADYVGNTLPRLGLASCTSPGVAGYKMLPQGASAQLGSVARPALFFRGQGQDL